MSYWIELHCDVLAPDDKARVRLHPACHTNAADNPGIGVTNKDVRGALARLRQEAIRAGWKKTNRGWECPYCQTQPPQPPRTHR